MLSCGRWVACVALLWVIGCSSGDVPNANTFLDAASPTLIDSGFTPSNDGSVSADAGRTCDEDFRSLQLEWPMEGVEGSDWVLRNYVDLDEGEGSLRDYRGRTDDEAKTYDGHRGVDISVANFREMEKGHVIVAAATGVVEDVVDVHDDRSTSFFDGCGPVGNHVVIRRPSGIRIRYLHLQTGSARVSVGETVSVGQALATVGSAGCSTWPHLHFDVTDCDGRRVSPFEHGLWAAPPEYTVPMTIMDVVFRDARIESVDDIRDAGPDAERFFVGGALGLGLVLAGGRAGERLDVRIVREDGSVFDEMTSTNEREYTRSHRWWNRTLSGSPGEWRIELSIEGALQRMAMFTVE